MRHRPRLGGMAIAATLLSCRHAPEHAPEPLISTAVTIASNSSAAANEMKAWDARCRLHHLWVCGGWDNDGTLTFCGPGRAPAVGERYKLHMWQLRRDYPLATVVSVTKADEGPDFRATATAPRALWPDDYGPSGGVGPWSDSLDLGSGDGLFGDAVREIGETQTWVGFAFANGGVLEVRHTLESCTSQLLETIFIQGNRWCVTEVIHSFDVGMTLTPPECDRPRIVSDGGS